MKYGIINDKKESAVLIPWTNRQMKNKVQLLVMENITNYEKNLNKR